MIQSDLADPAHVCIVGASYGGYAALLGAAKEPDLYRCAVSIAGPSDLGNLLFDFDKDSERMAAALRENGKSVQLVLQKNGDHFLSDENQRVEMLEQLGRFLADNL